jgi:histone H2B
MDDSDPIDTSTSDVSQKETHEQQPNTSTEMDNSGEKEAETSTEKINDSGEPEIESESEVEVEPVKKSKAVEKQKTAEKPKAAGTAEKPKRRGRPPKSGKAANTSMDGEGKKKRKKKATVDSYSTYIHRVLKEVHPDTGITGKSMSVLDSLVKDIFLKLGREASELAKHAKKKTITSHEVEFATRLVLPGELAKHAIIEANKAKFKYGTTSRS